MIKKQTKRIAKIVFIIASISNLYFVPWILVWAWILPLPDNVQEQLDEGVGHGFDGMIVYVDEGGKPPEFYAAGLHDQKTKYLPTRTLFKIAGISRLCDAVAITKLAKAGRLSLDQTPAVYFPELIGRIENRIKLP